MGQISKLSVVQCCHTFRFLLCYGVLSDKNSYFDLATEKETSILSAVKGAFIKTAGEGSEDLMEGARKIFVLMRRGYEFFLIPREVVLLFFKID